MVGFRGWLSALSLVLWAPHGVAAAQDVALRYPEQFCTVTAEGAAECVPLSSLPSRGLIERLLTDLSSEPGEEVQSLRCDGSGREVVVDAGSSDASLPTRHETVDPESWSLLSVERAEQNILALLRSCAATQRGAADPVASGQVPAGAAPRIAALTPPPRFPVEIDEARAVDAEGVPLNPFDAEQGALPGEAHPAAEAESGEVADGTRSPERPANQPQLLAKVADDLAEEFAAGMYDVDPSESEEVSESAPSPVVELAPPLPEGVRIVDGYDELRPRVERLVITWLEGAPAAQALGIDPCADPIGMPAMGECELSL